MSFVMLKLKFTSNQILLCSVTVQAGLQLYKRIKKTCMSEKQDFILGAALSENYNNVIPIPVEAIRQTHRKI